MKKIYFSALSILFGFGVNAQTLTQANNAPAAGDLYSKYQCDSAFIPSAVTGSASVWNYTTIATHSSIVNNYTAVTSNNPAYPSANVSVGSGGSDISYYLPSATGLKYYGGYLNLNGVSAQITYTASATYASYPMNFSTTVSSNVSGTVSVPNFGQTGSFSGTCVATSDGTGTLNLPGRSFSSVIRTAVSQTLIIPFNLPVGTGTVNQTIYSYFDPTSSKYPLLSYVGSTVNFPGININNSTEILASIQKNYQMVGLKENNKEEISLNVYPNPANTNVNFASANTNAKSLAIYDVTGKLVESQLLNDGKLNLNVADYNNGIYIYKLLDNTNNTLKTGKLTVAH